MHSFVLASVFFMHAVLTVMGVGAVRKCFEPVSHRLRLPSSPPYLRENLSRICTQALAGACELIFQQSRTDLNLLVWPVPSSLSLFPPLRCIPACLMSLRCLHPEVKYRNPQKLSTNCVQNAGLDPPPSLRFRHLVRTSLSICSLSFARLAIDSGTRLS